MDIEFDDTKHEFFFDAPLFSTNIFIGSDHAFLVHSSMTEGEVDAMEQLLKSGAGLFGNLTNSVVSMTASCIVFVPAKQMPNPSPQALGAAFEFGFVQGIQQSDLLLEYWGKASTDGRTFVHTALSNRFEVDTTETTKPYTRIPAKRRTIQLINSTKPGFIAFKVTANMTDHPQMAVSKSVFAKKPSEFLAREHLFRRANCTFDFATVFVSQDLSNKKINPISATQWSVKWDHVVTYQEARDKSNNIVLKAKSEAIGLLPTLPSGGSPAAVDKTTKDVVAMAEKGSPLMTPEVFNSRMSSNSGITKTEEDKNPDFDAKFIKKL